jgi:predicted membrane protein
MGFEPLQARPTGFAYEGSDAMTFGTTLRVGSVILALIASVIGLVFPFLLARQANGLNQSILLLMMVGIAGAFIHGAGFQPHARAMKIITSPWSTWPVITACCALMVALSRVK